MESKINSSLQDMPQLVIAKIMTFLNHRQLLILEQVSKKLKGEVEDHFRTTDHLIIGYLPSILKKREGNKKLLQLIQRCGIRLQTIQANANEFFDYDGHRLLDQLFESGGEVISKTCPNIEYIITSPKMDSNSKLFNGQVVGLSCDESYTNHLHKLGDKCKLRAIRIKFIAYNEEIAETKFKAIVDCYPNLQHILFHRWNRQQFLRYLPQLIKNGLKDLIMDRYLFDFKDAEQYCKIGIDLRSLRFAVSFKRDDDIAFMNQLKLPKGLELEIFRTNTSSLAFLNENVCGSVVKMVCKKSDTSDCSSLIKLKNLREFEGVRLEHSKLIAAKETFPKLKQVNLFGSGWIRCNACYRGGYRNTMCSSIFLPQLLTSKGHQLTDIRMRVCSSLHLVVKAVKYCKAARNVDLCCTFNVNLCTTSITIEDIMTILQLSRLQTFRITEMVSAPTDIDDLQQKMLIAENEQTHFKFEYGEIGKMIRDDVWCELSYTFDRIDI